MRPVPRVKKHAVATLNSTRVMKGVASLNRNQAITHGGKEVEMSLIVAAEHGREPGAPSAIGRLIAGSIEDGDHGCSLAGGYALFWSPVYEPPDLCRYQPHLPEAIEDSPELWPRHKAHGSIRVPEGQPTAGFWLCVQVGISACRPSSQSFLKLLIRRLEECPAAIADHPVARAGGIAGIAQVEPDDAHAAAVCGGEQPAHRNPAASALRPETTRVEALDRGGGLAVCRLTRAIVEIVREIGRDDDQGFGPSPDSVEQGYNRLRRSIAGDDRDQGKFIERHLQEW